MMPLTSLNFFSPWLATPAALLLGFGFGFWLERGGLGNARKLTGMFYLTDFVVVRVMFSAVVVAAFGLALFQALGILDLKLVYLPPLALGGIIIGGLLMGIGFVTGGY
ncbi:MAG: hypothetical protein HYY96_15485 [Candidatus Tectomicrobia bacterium]|nr:hypothetical protein [Candidatus Tectomicrobia bacterium]